MDSEELKQKISDQPAIQQNQQKEEESLQDRYLCKECSIYLDGIKQFDKHAKVHQKQDKARKQKNIRKRNKKNTYGGKFWGWGYGRKVGVKKVSKNKDKNQNQNQENGNGNGQGKIYCYIVTKVKRIRKEGTKKPKNNQLEWMKKNQDNVQGHEVGSHKLRERKKINYVKYIAENQNKDQQYKQKQQQQQQIKVRKTKKQAHTNTNTNNRKSIDIQESAQLQRPAAKTQTQNKTPFIIQNITNRSIPQYVHQKFQYNMHNDQQQVNYYNYNVHHQNQNQYQSQNQNQNNNNNGNGNGNKEEQDDTEKSLKIIIQEQYKWISRLNQEVGQVRRENAELKTKMDMIVSRNNYLEEEAKRFLYSGFNNVQTFKPSLAPTQKPKQQQPKKPVNPLTHNLPKNTGTNPKKPSQSSKASQKPVQKSLQHFFRKPQTQKNESKQNISSNISQKDQKINQFAHGKEFVKVEQDDEIDGCQRQKSQASKYRKNRGVKIRRMWAPCLGEQQQKQQQE